MDEKEILFDEELELNTGISDAKVPESETPVTETEETDLETVQEETPWETPVEPETQEETRQEKKARKKEEKAEKKAVKAAKKQKRAERRNTKAAKLIRRVTIWVLGIFLLLLAGYATSHITVYRPTRASLEEAKADLVTAQEKVSALESEVETLTALKTTNENLEDEIADVNTHITILSARVAVTDALLALQDDDLAAVNLELDKAVSTLETLKPMLKADQRETVTSMEQRLDLVIGELDEDTSAAKLDLEVLSSKLISLENTIFANP